MDNTVPAGKRKSDVAFPPAAADDGRPNLFVSLSDENWKMISSYAAPPDVYNLSLSSVHFFREATVTASSDNNSASSAEGNKAVLATQLLRSSLLASLGRVLEKSSSGITLDAVLKMGELPEGSALIAGSTIVAACLGEDWDSADVDVYCSAQAAPQVRSWLVEQANCMFVGVDDSYIDFVSDRLLYVVDTKIHHVESWGSFAQNFEGKYSFRSRREESESEYREQRNQWGKGVVEYANWKWKHSMNLGLLGVVPVNDGSHDIKPKPGGNLPFDFEGYGGVDLIVAKTGIPASSLLDGFDLEICKASFDGKKFHIPDPHLTFAGKTRMETNRREVVSSYVKYHREPEDRYSLSSMDLSLLVSGTIRAVRKDVPNAPFYSLLDVAEILPDRYNPNATFWESRGTFRNDSVVQAKWAPPIQFHNWCCALIRRLRKYQKRGIDVVDAPTIAADFLIDRYEIMSHGG